MPACLLGERKQGIRRLGMGRGMAAKHDKKEEENDGT